MTAVQITAEECGVAHRCDISAVTGAVIRFSFILAVHVLNPILSLRSADLIIATTTGLQHQVGLGCLAAPFVKPAALMAIGHLTKA